MEWNISIQKSLSGFMISGNKIEKPQAIFGVYSILYIVLERVHWGSMKHVSLLNSKESLMLNKVL